MNSHYKHPSRSKPTPSSKTKSGSKPLKGYLFAAIAAAAYGTNPAFALPLYDTGMNPSSVLIFRYLLGVPLLAMMIKYRKRKLSLTSQEIIPVSILGILMALSSLSLFESYKHMNSGLASTLLFVYPVMTAIIMIFFFHEKFRPSIAICLIVMSGGIALLAKPSGDSTISTYGTILVMISALTYAMYLVMINASKTVRSIATSRLMLWVLIYGTGVFLVASFISGQQITLPSHSAEWVNLACLAIIPTVISLTLTTKAIQLIGATPTAILGALEPVSAVILSVVVLRQPITLTEIAGGTLIVLATVLVISDRTPRPKRTLSD